MSERVRLSTRRLRDIRAMVRRAEADDARGDLGPDDAPGIAEAVDLLRAVDDLRGDLAVARRALSEVHVFLARIIEINENSPRDPVYEAAVRGIGSHACGAIMSAARHVWLDLLREEYGISDGAHCVAPALPVLRSVIAPLDTLLDTLLDTKGRQ